MTIRWLGQQTLALVAGHVYQARWLVPGGGGDFPCPISDARVTQVRDILGSLGSVVTPGLATADWEVPAVLKVPNATVFDQLRWPADRREVPPSMGRVGTCPVWTSSVPTQDMNLPLTAVQQALAPLGGVLLNLWDNTSGQRIWDQPTGTAPPLPPVTPPPVVIPTTPPVQPTQTPLPPTEKKKPNPVVYVVVGALAIGALALALR